MFTYRFGVHLSHLTVHCYKGLHHASVKGSEDPSTACAFYMMNTERLYDSSKTRVTGRWEAHLHVSVCLSVSLFNSGCVGCRTFFLPYSQDSCGRLIRVCIPQVYLRGETFYYTLSLKSMTNCFLFSLSLSLRHSPFLDGTFSWVWGWEGWGVDVSRWVEQTVNCAGEEVPEQIFVSLCGFFQFFAIGEKTGKRLELQSDVKHRGWVIASICIQVLANKQTIRGQICSKGNQRSNNESNNEWN